MRRIKCQDPRSVNKYNKLVHQEFQEHNLFYRVKTLFEKSKEGWDDALEQEYNQIYELQLQIRKKMEKKVRKLRTGAVPWSPKLQKYRTTIKLWTLILRRKKKVRTSLTKIRRLIKITECYDALKSSRNEAWQNLQQACKEYNTTKKSAGTWRNTFLDDLA